MATRTVEDLPIRPNRVATNRDDPKNGEGVFVRLVSTKNAEQVTPNALTWNNDAQGIVDYEESTRKFPKGDTRRQGNRATRDTQGGNKMVNYPDWPAVLHGGNDSGE